MVDSAHKYFLYCWHSETFPELRSDVDVAKGNIDPTPSFEANLNLTGDVKNKQNITVGVNNVSVDVKLTLTL